MILINSITRQFNVPGTDLVFGVVADSDAERKFFQCPRYVGDNLDLASCFIRINYRNANGKEDFYLVDDMAIDGDNITFSWLLSPKVTEFKGQVKFVMCAVGPDLKLKWHTTQGTGQVMEGLEPDNSHVESQTADVVAQLIAMTEAQTTAVESVGAEQIVAIKSATETATTTAVNEIEAKRANSLASIPNDYTALSGAVENLARGKGGAIVCEAEGAVVSVSDASDMAMQGVRIFGRSTQDGTPTPSAPVEIKSVESPGVTVRGNNLLDTAALTAKTEYHGIKAEYEGDGIFRFYGTVTSTQTTSHLTTELSIPIDPDKNYTLCAEVMSGGITGITRIHPYLGVGTAPGNRMNWLAVKIDSETPVGSVVGNTAKAVTFNPDAKFITRFWVYFAQPTVGDVIDIRIRLWAIQSDAPEAYEPYVGQSVSIPRTLPGVPVETGGNYTDANGQQWICDEVDLERGVLIKRLVSHVLTSDLLMYVWTDTERERGITVRGLPMDYSVRRDAMALCSHYRTRANGSIVLGQIGIRLLGDYTSIYLLHEEGVATTIDEWKTFFDRQVANGTPVTVLVKAEAETEIPLSETEIAAYRNLHSNYPNTTVLNDAGAHMVVKYAADTKLYIDKKIKEALL